MRSSIPRDTNELTVRRPVGVYIFHLVWILYAPYKAYVSSSDFALYSWMIILMLVLANFFNILVRKNYFEIKDNQLCIYRDYFRIEVIQLDKIDRVDLESSPFRYSRIILKDKSEVKFNDHYTGRESLNKLMQQLNIPVV